jgi:hypothetical protein
MATVYTKANAEITRAVMSALEYHPILQAAGVELAILVAESDSGEPPLSESGASVAATLKLSSAIIRAISGAHAVLILDAAQWDRMSAFERIALADQQLERIGVLRHKEEKFDPEFCEWDEDKKEAIGDIKTDFNGNPKLKIKPWDYQIFGFRSVVRRHHMNAPEVQQARQCQDERGQYVWEWASRLEVPEDEASAPSFSGFPKSTIQIGNGPAVAIEDSNKAMNALTKGKKSK